MGGVPRDADARPGARAAHVHIASLAEVQELCGSRALGCYSRDEMVSLGEPAPDGTTPEEVVRHEYGHHVAWYRLNTPWRAIDWGPKNWASAATRVLARCTARGVPREPELELRAEPGRSLGRGLPAHGRAQGGDHDRDLADHHRRASSPTRRLFVAAERDVLQPWTVNTEVGIQAQLREGREEGMVDPGADAAGRRPRAQRDPSAQRASRGRTRRRQPAHRPAAGAVGRRSARSALTTGICGQRCVFVRVTPSGAAGRVTVTVSSP